jgi:hypothetical protein
LISGQGYIDAGGGCNLGLQRTLGEVTTRLLGVDGAAGDSWMGAANAMNTATSWNINRTFLEISDIILEKFTNPSRSNIGYYSVPRMNYTPSYDSDKIHDDGDEPDKSIIIIIYFHPTCSPGTNLYKNKSPESFVKEITWRQNSALIISPKEGVTWHDFKAKDEGRFTLNFYYEKLEYSDVVHKFNNKKLMWFYQAMATDDFMIELKK